MKKCINCSKFLNCSKADENITECEKYSREVREVKVYEK